MLEELFSVREQRDVLLLFQKDFFFLIIKNLLRQRLWEVIKPTRYYKFYFDQTDRRT